MSNTLVAIPRETESNDYYSRRLDTNRPRKALHSSTVCGANKVNEITIITPTSVWSFKKMIS